MGAYEQMFGTQDQTKTDANLVAPTKSKNFGKNPNLKAEEELDDLDKLMLGSIERNKQKQVQTEPQQVQQTTQAPPVNRPPVTQQQPKQDSALTQFGQGLAALGDVTVGGVLPAIAGTVAYPIARAGYGLTMPPEKAAQKAQELQQGVVGAIDKPFGKAFGVTETQGYKGEATNQIMNFIGENASKGADWISKYLGIPKADVESYMNTIGIGVSPMAGKALSATGKGVVKAGEVVGKELGYAGEAVKTAVEPMQKAFEKAKEKMPTVRVEKAPEIQKGPELTKHIDQLEQQFQQQKATGETKPAVETVTSPTGEPVAQVELGTAKPTPPDAPFSELSYSEKSLPLDEQYARAKVLQKVLGDDHEVDLAAIEGKGKERATNFDVSRSDTSQGNMLAERIADEQKRLAQYGQNLIKKTGGTVGLDETSKYNRGNSILAPFEEYGNHLDKEINKLYAERDKTAKEVPVQTNFTRDLLNDESVTQLGDNDKLAKAAKAKMNQLGMMDKDGNLLNTTAHTAEQFRKWLNSPSVWSPQNAGLHRLLKDSIDNDVFAHADEAIYKDARALHGLKKDTLDNPQGIATILDESGPNGINRKVGVEDVPKKIAGMSVDQFTHIIDTLDKMPSEMQGKAQKAKSEIKAHFLNQALEQKSPAKLTEYMNNNREVMNRLFTPEEMADVRDYHNASQILKTDIGYKGAAVQKINVEQKLLGKVGEQLLKKGGAAVAETAFMGAGHGIPATIAHEYIGGKFEKSHAKKVAKAEEEATKKAQERFVPIKDLLKLKPETTNRIELRNMAPGQPD
jgi:hypothetical protein